MRYEKSAELFAIWSPPLGSPWEAYHCAPLFAALDRVPSEARGATDSNLVKGWEPPLDPFKDWLKSNRQQLGEHVWLIVDLPGPQSVALAPSLVGAGFQTICTFDHWPHPKGVLHPEWILAQLLRHASTLEYLKRDLSPAAPPAWLCDRNRLGKEQPRPNQFDNRYFLDDSILPSLKSLRARGIGRVICLQEAFEDQPQEDLSAYLQDLRNAGLRVEGMAVLNPDQGFYPILPPPNPSPFNKFPYVRAAAGGFGRLVPSESSSSG